MNQQQRRDMERMDKFSKYKFIYPEDYYKLSKEYIDTWVDTHIDNYSYVSSNVLSNDFLREEFNVIIRGGGVTQMHSQCKYDMNRIFKNQILRLKKQNKLEKYSYRNYKVL
jgi:hypothetical protein